MKKLLTKKNIARIKKLSPLLCTAAILTILTFVFFVSNLKLNKSLEEKPTDIVVTNISTVRANIYWQTDTETEYIIQYKKSSDSGLYREINEVKKYGNKDSDNQIYSVNISGLEPNTEYLYRIKSDDKILYDGYSFRTENIAEEVNLPYTITGKGDTESLYLLSLDGHIYMLDTQDHGTWAFDSQGKEYTVDMYASYSSTPNLFSRLKDTLISMVFADYVTKDNDKDEIIIYTDSEWGKHRECKDLDGCTCKFPSGAVQDVVVGKTCHENGTVTDTMKCCSYDDEKSYITVAQCLAKSDGTVEDDIEEEDCVSSDDDDDDDDDEENETGDYKNSDGDKDTMTVNDSSEFNKHRKCKDVDGCICEYASGGSKNAKVGETCNIDGTITDTTECCVVDDEKSYIKVKDCLKEDDFDIIDDLDKATCEAKDVCCSTNGTLTYGSSADCEGDIIENVSESNCKAQSKNIEIKEGVNFIEAYYLVNSTDTPIQTAKELIIFSNYKIVSVGVFKNDKWEKLVKYENGVISGENFDLLPNESYLVIANEDVDIPTSVVVSQKTINIEDYVGWNLVSSSSLSDDEITSDEIFNDTKYNSIKQIAQWSTDTSMFRYAIRDLTNSTYGETINITDQEGVFIKAVD